MISCFILFISLRMILISQARKTLTFFWWGVHDFQAIFLAAKRTHFSIILVFNNLEYKILMIINFILYNFKNEIWKPYQFRPILRREILINWWFYSSLVKFESKIWRDYIFEDLGLYWSCRFFRIDLLRSTNGSTWMKYRKRL